jgi:hypothetical protein
VLEGAALLAPIFLGFGVLLSSPSVIYFCFFGCLAANYLLIVSFNVRAAIGKSTSAVSSLTN